MQPDVAALRQHHELADGALLHLELRLHATLPVRCRPPAQAPAQAAKRLRGAVASRRLAFEPHAEAALGRRVRRQIDIGIVQVEN